MEGGYDWLECWFGFLIILLFFSFPVTFIIIRSFYLSRCWRVLARTGWLWRLGFGGGGGGHMKLIEGKKGGNDIVG